MIYTPLARPHVAQFIVEKIRFKGTTAKEAAKLLNTSAPVLSMVMNGRRSPNAELVEAFCNHFCDSEKEASTLRFLAELSRRVSFTPKTEAELEIYVEFEKRLIENHEAWQEGSRDGHAA